MSTNDIYNLRIPGNFPAEYLVYASEQGVDFSAILKKVGLSTSIEDLATQGLSFGVMESLLNELWETLPDESIGFRAGWRVPPTSFGSFGYAALCCENLRAAISLCHRYWDLFGRGVRMLEQTNGKDFILTFDVEVPVTGFLRRWMIESALASAWRALTGIIPEAVNCAAVTFNLPQPAHFDLIQEYIPGASYDFPVTALRFPVSLLKQPFPLSSPSGLRQAELLCDAQMRLWAQPEPTATSVRRTLGLAANGFPSLEETATYLRMSTRTLRRRLDAEGSSYAILLKESRLQDAVHLLSDPRLSIDVVANRLSYQDDANFCRAFKKWTGSTPTAFRRNMKSRGEGESRQER